jgi:hypothetical protein
MAVSTTIIAHFLVKKIYIYGPKYNRNNKFMVKTVQDKFTIKYNKSDQT